MAQLSPTIEVTSALYSQERRITIVVASIAAFRMDGEKYTNISTLGGHDFTVKESYTEVKQKIADA